MDELDGRPRLAGLSVVSLSLARRGSVREATQRSQRLYVCVFELTGLRLRPDSQDLRDALYKVPARGVPSAQPPLTLACQEGDPAKRMLQRLVNQGPYIPAGALDVAQCPESLGAENYTLSAQLLISSCIAVDQERASFKPGLVTVPLLFSCLRWMDSAFDPIEPVFNRALHVPETNEEIQRAVSAKRAQLFRPSCTRAIQPASARQLSHGLSMKMRVECRAQASTALSAADLEHLTRREIKVWLPSIPSQATWSQSLPQLTLLETFAGGSMATRVGSQDTDEAAKGSYELVRLVRCFDALGSAQQRAQFLPKLIDSLTEFGTSCDQKHQKTRVWLQTLIHEENLCNFGPPPITVTISGPALFRHFRCRPIGLTSLLLNAPAESASPNEVITGLDVPTLNAPISRLLSSMMRGMGPRVGALRVPSDNTFATMEKKRSFRRTHGALSMLTLPMGIQSLHSRIMKFTESLGVQQADLAGFRRLNRPSKWRCSILTRVSHARLKALLRTACNDVLHWRNSPLGQNSQEERRPQTFNARKRPAPLQNAEPSARRRASDVLSWLNSAEGPSPSMGKPGSLSKRAANLTDGGDSLEKRRGRSGLTTALPSSHGLARSDSPMVSADVGKAPRSPITLSRAMNPRPVSRSWGMRCIGLRAAELTSSQRSLTRPHMELEETIEETVDAYFTARRSGEERGASQAGPRMENSAPLSLADISSTMPSEPLIVKLERAARRGPFLAVLPGMAAQWLPMIAAQLFHALVPNEHGTAMWLLPGDVIPAAIHFWQCLGPTNLRLRTLTGMPGANNESPLEKGHIGLISLANISSAQASCEASLVVLTMSPPDLAACAAACNLVGNGPKLFLGTSPQLVALVCELPGDSDSLLPMCRALGVAYLHARIQSDPDVIALSRQYREHRFEFPSELSQICDELWEVCQHLFNEAKQLATHLSGCQLATPTLSEAIETFPRGNNPAAFQRLMACLCARRALDLISYTDTAGLRVHLDTCARSLKYLSACRPHAPVSRLLADRKKVQTAVQAVVEAREEALRIALREAIADGFGQVDGKLYGGDGVAALSTDVMRSGEARHGVVVFAHSCMQASTKAVCQSILSEHSSKDVSAPNSSRAVHVVAVDAEMEHRHVLNLLNRARQIAGGGGVSNSFLFLMSHEKLQSFEIFPWEAFRLYVEIDKPGRPFHFSAQLQQPRLCVHLLQPDMTKRRGMLTAKAPATSTNGDVKTSLMSMDLIPHADDENDHVDALRTARTELSPLDQSVRLLRRTRGTRYDDPISLGALQVQNRKEIVSATMRPLQPLPHGRAPLVSWPVMAGESLLDAQKLYSLLRRKGVRLIETSTPLPHLILGAEAGLLACDQEALSSPTSVATAVRMCESVMLREVWLLVLMNGNHCDPNERTDVEPAHNKFSCWKLIASVLAQTSGSPLRLCVRLSSWRDAWKALQQIIFLYRPPASEWPWHSEGGEEETEHERLLVVCGLSPWTARKVIKEYTLRSLLSLSPEVRSRHFAWLPPNVLQSLSALDDDCCGVLRMRPSVLEAGVSENNDARSRHSEDRLPIERMEPIDGCNELDNVGWQRESSKIIDVVPTRLEHGGQQRIAGAVGASKDVRQANTFQCIANPGSESASAAHLPSTYQHRWPQSSMYHANTRNSPRRVQSRTIPNNPGGRKQKIFKQKTLM